MRGWKKESVVGVALIAATLAFTGCAYSGTGGGSGGATVITHEQLLATNQNDLYEAIRNLRPTWVRPRGANSISGPTDVVLYLNGSPYGTVADLNTIPLDSVEEVRFMSASEAGARYGTVAGSSGLLLVRTRS